MSETVEQANARYAAAGHAMQTAVAIKMQHDGSETEPKHLRVGVNSALSSQGGLVTLLIAKGVFTLEEYSTAMADAMEREVETYREELIAERLIDPTTTLL
jgi:hypothetical protein